MDLIMDFASDLVAHMRRTLGARKLKTRATDSHDDTGYQYALMKRREISVRPRSVYVARDFVCPVEHLAGLSEVRRKAAAGESLAPHQRKVSRADDEDALLNDWDVHHFHLGLALGKGGLVERTKALLFARVTEDAFYMIGVFHHRDRRGGPHPGDFARQHVFQTIAENWPETLVQVGNKPEAYLSDSELADFRENRISPLPAAAGAVYGSPGLGTAMDGSSVLARMASDTYFRCVRELEQEVLGGIDAFSASARSRGVELKEPFQFRLILSGPTAPSVVESGSGFHVPLAHPFWRSFVAP